MIAEHPALSLMLGGMLLGWLPRKLANSIMVVLPLWALYSIWQVPREVGADLATLPLAGFNLLLFHVNAFTHIFATIFAIAALGGGIFALKHAKKREIAAGYIYAGTAIGVTFSGDFFSLFIYWEIMAIVSTFIVLCGATEGSFRAAMRYAAIHFLGGVVLLVGIIAYGDMVLAPVTLNSIAGWCILAGVLVNVAALPFSAWLPDAYPEASPFGAVFLSAFTTKTAVYVLLTLFAGNAILMYIGLFMVFYGIIYGLVENDIRRILAYSIISQVGFMVTGVGIGTPLALYGVAAHAFCHILYKALLMMVAGSVLFMTGHRKCTELGGLSRSMKLTAFCGVIGALSISAFPFTSGFVSKSMIAAAAADGHSGVVWLLLLAASAGTFLYVGLRFTYYIFFSRDCGLRPKDPPWNMRMVMVMFALLCILPGIFPEWLYAMLPTMPDYTPNTWEHIITQMQLLFFSGLAFFALLPWLKRTDTISLDSDWLYRVFVLNLLLLGEQAMAFIGAGITKLSKTLQKRCMKSIVKINGSEGVLARNWSVGVTVMWIMLLLSVSLVVYYVGW